MSRTTEVPLNNRSRQLQHYHNNREEILFKQKKNKKNYYKKNKARMLKDLQQKRRENLEEINRWKASGCKICGFDKHTSALEAHHLDPSQKEGTLSKMTSSFSKEKIAIELQKCVCLCCNCHRLVHAGVLNL